MSARTKKEFRSAETWVPNDESEMKNLKGNLQEADPEEQRVDPVLSWMNLQRIIEDPCRLPEIAQTVRLRN